MSTGPRTSSGKRASSRNALKHGLLSRQIVLSDEDPKEFDDLRSRLIDDLSPAGELEMLFAERIVLATWRLRRVVRLEAAVFRAQQLDVMYIITPTTPLPRLRQPGETDSGVSTPEPERVPEPEEAVHNAMVRDANGTNQLERLRRYEVTLERSLLASVHELERLQKRRAGQDIPAPAVLDVNLRDDG